MESELVLCCSRWGAFARGLYLLYYVTAADQMPAWQQQSRATTQLWKSAPRDRALVPFTSMGLEGGSQAQALVLSTVVSTGGPRSGGLWGAA